MNVSSAAEKGLAADVKAAREAKWKEKNAGAIADCNAYVDKHGIPFADLRKF